MKKLIIIAVTSFLLLSLAACDTELVDIPINPETAPEVVEEEPEVNENPPVQTEPEQETITPEVTPEVVIEFIDRFIEVPAEVERLRRYQPGTYMAAEPSPNSQNGHVFVVVMIDDYGFISSVYIDQTISTRVLFVNPSGLVYTFVQGNNVNIPDSYRLVDVSQPVSMYPTVDDAIRVTDLVVGIDNTEIRRLTRTVVNETKQIGSDRVVVTSSLSYEEQMTLVADKVVQDNTTYGFNLINQGNIVTTTSIPNIDQPLDIPLFLIQSILDGPATLSSTTSLRSLDTPRYGEYQPGLYVEYSPAFVENDGINHAISLIGVDRFGRIFSSYIDETVGSTARTGVFSSKQILGDAFPVNGSDATWSRQANSISQQIIFNQGVEGFTYQLIGAQGNVSNISYPFTTSLPVQLSNLEGSSVPVNHFIKAVNSALSNARFGHYIDGVYNVLATDGSNQFAIVTIENNTIIDIYVDRFIRSSEARLFRQNQEVSLESFPRSIGTLTATRTVQIPVYRIGSSYYFASNLTHLGNVPIIGEQQITQDQLVTLSLQERDQLSPVSAVQTSRFLKDVDASQAQWVQQTDQVISRLVDAGTTTSFFLSNGRFLSLVSEQSIPVESIFNLVTKALYQARTEGNAVTSLGSSLVDVPIADGSYVAFQAPTSTGETPYSYMMVRSGRVVTWVVDRTLLRGETMTSVLLSSSSVDTSRQRETASLMQHLLDQQTAVISSTIVDPLPNLTFLSVRGQSVFSSTTYADEIYAQIESIDSVVQQAARSRLNQDMQTIQAYFESNPNTFPTQPLVAFQTKTRWVPSILSLPTLSANYRLEWSTPSRDIDIELEGLGYTFSVEQVAENITVPVTVDVFLANSNQPYLNFTYDLNVIRRFTNGQQILNDDTFDFPSLRLLENTAFNLPTSSEVDVRWISSNTNAISAAGQTVATNVPLTATLTAYVDLDANAQRGPNEPFRDYNITVLPRAQAVEEVIARLDTNQIVEYIDPVLVLGTDSSVWGITYTWSSSSPQVRISTVSGVSTLTIGKLDFQQDIPITARFNLPNTTHAVSYRLDAGRVSIYEEFTSLDMPEVTTSNTMIPGQALFSPLGSRGLRFGSELSFITTDFGRFVNTSGVIIYQHPTEDACFDLRLTAKYSGGITNYSQTIEEPFCVISTRSLQTRLNADRNQVRDIVIDLSLNNHRDRVITLPVIGDVYGYPLIWSVNDSEIVDPALFDTSALSSGVLTVKTSNQDFAATDDLVLTLTVEVPLFGGAYQRVTKNITIDIRE